VQFIPQSIKDVILIEPTVHGDSRGYFCETFRQDLLDSFFATKINFVQDNESLSSKGVVRGLHYQTAPFSQSKLIRVSNGRILDIALDIRKSSSSFGEHISIELSDKNMRQLFIPSGFAHGFIVLSETAKINYKVDNYYSLECDRGIAFNDPNLKINWLLPKDDLKLSNKDMMHPKLKDASDLFD
tara:strand:- start:934 stop:1488 length:555 start_codon:yes stop_codon:yes gene_type:complete